MSSLSYLQKSIILNEKHLIKDKLRWDQVRAPQLYQHPHDCIGWIIVTSQNDPYISGSAFLISSKLILTSAHTFELIINDKMYLPNPESISFNLMEKNQSESRSIKVKSIRVPRKYEIIINQIIKLRAKRDSQQDKAKRNQINQKIKQLHHQEMQNDFALLELEQEVIRNRYFELPLNINSFPQPQLAVSGYVQDMHTGQYRHFTHFEVLAQIKYGAAFYDIDTEGGQSGAPAYLIYGNRVVLIGIHKGYSREDNLNYCTMITEEVIAILKEWLIDMKGSLEELNLEDKIVNNSKAIQMIKQQYQCICQTLRKEINNKDMIISQLRQEQDLTLKKFKGQYSQETNYNKMSQIQKQNNNLKLQIDDLTSQKLKLKQQIEIANKQLKAISEQAQQKFKQFEMIINDGNQLAMKIQNKFKAGYNPMKSQQFGNNPYKQGIFLQILGYGYDKIVSQLRKISSKQSIISLTCINTVAFNKFSLQILINSACKQKIISVYMIKYSAVNKTIIQCVSNNQFSVSNYIFRSKYISIQDVDVEQFRVQNQIFRWLVFKYLVNQIIYFLRQFSILRNFTLWIKHNLQKVTSFNKLVVYLNSKKLDSIDIYIRMDRKKDEEYDWTKDLVAGRVKKEYVEW